MRRADEHYSVDAALMRSLARENDKAVSNPFKRIANLIEKSPEGLFKEKKA